jgi:hypothetical protein
VLADWSRLNYWEGDLCCVPVILSHWSAAEVRDYTLEWNISELGVFGSIPGVHADRGDSREVGRVTFVVPPLTDSVRSRLHLRLRDGEGRIVARNVQYLSFFPSQYRRPAQPQALWVHDPLSLWDMEERLAEAGYTVLESPPEDVGQAIAVTSRLDETITRFLEDGGSVLFLIRSPGDIAPEVVSRTSLRIRDRRARLDERGKEKNPWGGDWVSNFNWLKHEPLFERIPRVLDSPLPGELMDMQYYRIMPNQVLMGWNQEREFADIYAGMVVGWVHAPVALIAQCRWGEGRLLATPLRVESGYGDDPVATILTHNMLRHMASKRFRPQKDALAPRRSGRVEAPPEEEVKAGVVPSATGPVPEE